MMVEHVAFDIGQLNAQFSALAVGRVARTPAENASLYSFLLHARNLLGFYWPPRERDRRNGDVFAFDFVPGLVIADPGLNQSISEIKKVISTRVAHICLDRTKKVGWSATTIHDVLDDAGSQFLEQVQEPYRIRFVRCRVVHTSW